MTGNFLENFRHFLTMITQKIIYDLGSNNGSDLPYYLKKSDLVVAVEASPALCERIRFSFANEIRAGKLIVENCVLVAERNVLTVPFYIHKKNHVLSQLPRPKEKVLSDFECVELPAKNVAGLIEAIGAPYYVKIDVEHYDQEILKTLFSAGIFPPYISAESHSSEIFSILVAIGGYKAFKLVDGPSVSTKYRDYQIEVAGSTEGYSFPHHSAGPFGSDIKGPWMTPDNFFRLLGLVGLGWKDIHASKRDSPDQSYMPKSQFRLVVDF